MSDPLKNSIENTSDLWFFPPAKESPWLAKVDWYLNWQMCKGLDHGGIHVPAETLKVAEEFGIAVPEVSTRRTPLMVYARGLLPTNHCVVLETTNALGDWLKQIHDISKKLQAKSIQIFLPATASQETAQQAWEKLKSDLEIRFITDLETA